jgi:hypothetical protein
MSDERRASRARLSLLLIAAVAAAPLVAAYALFHFWRPSAFTNYGQLLPPDRIADVSIRQADGSDFTLATLKGKWVLMMVDSGMCDGFCRRKLYSMRQVRLTQGKDMERIERAYRGTRVVSARGSPLLSRLPADVSVRDHIYIVDPLGNLMMRYPRDADPSRIKKDMTRLLKVSGIG